MVKYVKEDIVNGSDDFIKGYNAIYSDLNALRSAAQKSPDRTVGRKIRTLASNIENDLIDLNNELDDNGYFDDNY